MSLCPLPHFVVVGKIIPYAGKGYSSSGRSWVSLMFLCGLLNIKSTFFSIIVCNLARVLFIIPDRLIFISTMLFNNIKEIIELWT